MVHFKELRGFDFRLYLKSVLLRQFTKCSLGIHIWYLYADFSGKFHPVEVTWPMLFSVQFELCQNAEKMHFQEK